MRGTTAVSAASAVSNLGQFSEAELAQALKLALEEGVSFACQMAMEAGGFYLNEAIKILWPPECREVAEKLSEIPGLGHIVEEFEEKLNTAAERAASMAVDIFVNAVKGLSVADAVKILTGSATSCTDYLIKTCLQPLLNAMRPIVLECLTACGVQQAWQNIHRQWDKIPALPFIKKPTLTADISEYALEKGCDGLFFLCAEKEKLIRGNALSAANDLVQKVFGEIHL